MKYIKYMKENLENLDPYGEEDWKDDEIELDKEAMENDAMMVVINDMYNYRDYIQGVLEEHFRNMNIDELKDFLGFEEDEECPACEGEGIIDGEECERCHGEGYIDMYEYKYGI